MLRFFSIFVLMFMICFGVKAADISIDGQVEFDIFFLQTKLKEKHPLINA